MSERETAQIRERAQRGLDGMAVNRDLIYRDVMYLCDLVDLLQEKLAQAQQKKPEFDFRKPWGF